MLLLDIRVVKISLGLTIYNLMKSVRKLGLCSNKKASSTKGMNLNNTRIIAHGYIKL